MVSRELLAGVLGVALGALLVVYPGAVLRAHAAGRLPDQGEYGSEGTPLSKWRPVVRAAGGVCVVLGLWFASQAL